MSKITKEMALEYHEEGRPGKIEVIPTKPYSSQRDLALAYSPGVAYPCQEIERHPDDVYKYTNKGNLIGVISNGTAVLGLGDIGALAGKPVMEGKALLFKIFAGLDAFDIELNENNTDKIIDIIKAISPTFGGINLEDIKSPECFTIEKRLKEECKIPVMHDDQHGTAIISGAGLLNALEIQGKDISKVKLVVNGAGAAAISCTRLYIELGVNRENVVMCDSKGVIRSDRTDLNSQKREFATWRNIHTLAEAMKDADIFLGLSVADVVTVDMVKSMAPKPIVFALANPNPEIAYELAKSAVQDIIVATGRSDYPNQINNVIGFPYIFRGALDSRATQINEEMKIAAVHAIAALAKEPVPAVVDEAYGKNDITFGRDYILPKPLDPRLLLRVAPAVAQAAAHSGVSQHSIKDIDKYILHLMSIMGDDGKMMRSLTEKAKQDVRRVVICEGELDNMLRAAYRLNNEKICQPVILGNNVLISKKAERLGLNLDGIEIINPRGEEMADERKRYAKILSVKKCREGFTFDLAMDKIYESSYFGMMMVEAGDADACLTASYAAGDSIAEDMESIVGLEDGIEHFATLNILNTRKGTYFIADTAINPDADTATLVDIARLAYKTVKFFAHEPIMAMLSYSNFGSSQKEEAKSVSHAVSILHEKYPEIQVDGEMQVNFALDTKLRDERFPFNTIKGKQVNTLIFPNLTAANCTSKMLLGMGIGSIIGPIQMGLRKPVYTIHGNSKEQEIVDLITIACVEASVKSKE